MVSYFLHCLSVKELPKTQPTSIAHPPLYIVKRSVVTVFSHIWNLTEWCKRQRRQVPVSLSSCIRYWCWVAELQPSLLFSMLFNPAFCPRMLLLVEYFSRTFSIALVRFTHWRTKGEKIEAGPLSNAPPSWVLWWPYFCWYSRCLSGSHLYITQVLAPPSSVPLRLVEIIGTPIGTRLPTIPHHVS